MVGFEVGGPVGNVTITGGVGFIKSITGETGDFIENLVRQLGVNVVGLLGTRNKDLALLRHLGGFFLTHRTT